MKVITACGSGLGSSLMVAMNTEKVLKELGREEDEVTHMDLSSVSFSPADLYVFGQDIGMSTEAQRLDQSKVILLKNILDKAELKSKLAGRIEANGL